MVVTHGNGHETHASHFNLLPLPSHAPHPQGDHACSSGRQPAHAPSSSDTQLTSASSVQAVMEDVCKLLDPQGGSSPMPPVVHSPAGAPLLTAAHGPFTVTATSTGQSLLDPQAMGGGTAMGRVSGMSHHLLWVMQQSALIVSCCSQPELATVCKAAL